MMFEWKNHNLLEPMIEVNSRGSLGLVWMCELQIWFLAILVLILSYKLVLLDVYDTLDTKYLIVLHKFWKMQEFPIWTMLLEI